MRDQNYDLIDLFKLIMSVGVVSIHIGVPGLKTIGRLAVPYFLIVSSYLFFIKYKTLDDNGKKKKIRKFCKRIILLFISWEIFYLPWAISDGINFFSEKGITIFSFMSYIWELIFYRNSLTGWGASWYLFALVWGLPVFCLAIKKFGIKNVGIISVAIEIYYIVTSGYLRNANIYHVIAPSFFVRIFIYLLIGYIIANWNIYLKPSLGCVIGISIIFLLENIFLWKIVSGISNGEEVITTTIASSIIFLYTLKNSVQIPHAITLRHLSTFIYCGHMLMMKIYPYYNFGDSKLVELLVVLVECCLIYFVWNFFYQRSSRSKFIFKYMI